jgi:hypothetical protein
VPVSRPSSAKWRLTSAQFASVAVTVQGRFRIFHLDLAMLWSLYACSKVLAGPVTGRGLTMRMPNPLGSDIGGVARWGQIEKYGGP